MFIERVVPLGYVCPDCGHKMHVYAITGYDELHHLACPICESYRFKNPTVIG